MLCDALGGERLSQLTHQLRKIVQEAFEAEGSEKQTEHWVVQPVLEALGWTKGRTVFGYTTSVKMQADFALLEPDKKRPLALGECKPVGARLKPHDVAQVLGYAHSEDVRWAILTNGLQWQVYDAKRSAKHPEKKLLEVDLGTIERSPGEVCGLLWLMSPESLEAGGLEKVAQAFEAYRALRRFLESTGAVAEALEAEKGNFREGLEEALAFARRCLPRTMSVVAGVAAQPAPPSADALPGITTLRTSGARFIVRFPDEAPRTVSRAKDLLKEVAEYLVRKGLLTPDRCPIKVTHGQCRLVHTEPRHEHHEFRSEVKLSNGLYLETHCSAAAAKEYARRLFRLLAPDAPELVIEEPPV